MNPTFNIDVAIIGGGIAGLWLLGRLREHGYSALLIEITGPDRRIWVAPVSYTHLDVYKRQSLAGTGSGSATGAGAVAPSRRLRSPRSAAPGSATSACGGTGKGRLASFSPQNSALPATRAQITRVHQRADMRRLSSTHSPQSVRTGPPPLP